MKGKKEEDGAANKVFILNALIWRCPDILNESTMFQFVGEEKLGIFFQKKSKYTPKLACKNIY